MTKLKSYVHESLSPNNPYLTHYKKICSETSTDDSDDNERIVYQDFTLARYDRATEFVPGNYDLIIDRISEAMENRFENISKSLILSISFVY